MMNVLQTLSFSIYKTDGRVVWIIVMFLSAVWTLILTAPIHCRASTGVSKYWCSKYISPNVFPWRNKLINI